MRKRRAAVTEAEVAAAATKQAGRSSRHAASLRHRLVRQQVYTNNERSAPLGHAAAAAAMAATAQAQAQPESGVEAVAVAVAVAPPSGHEQRPRTQENLALLGRQRAPSAGVRLELAADAPANLDPGVPTTTTKTTTTITISNAAAITASTASHQLPHECLKHHAAAAFHEAGESRNFGSHVATAAAAAPTQVGDSNSTANAWAGLQVDCGDQLALMNIRTEELNFADIQQVWLQKSWPEILARVSFVAPVVLLGLLGNLTIIYSMCRFKRIRSKPTNIFILNMAIADLLTSIVCPNAALLTDIYQFYVMGALVCRTEGFIKITCLLVSAYSLIVLSFDWFLSVVRPCRRRMNIRQAWLTLAAIWLVSLSMASPLLHWRRLRERHWRDLTETWCCELIQNTKYYWICMTLFLIYLPTFVMTIVLVVILAQMDRFEAKLRRSRAPAQKLGPSSDSCSGGRRFSLASPTASMGSISSGLAGGAPPVSSQNQFHLNSTHTTNTNSTTRISSGPAARMAAGATSQPSTIATSPTGSSGGGGGGKVGNGGGTSLGPGSGLEDLSRAERQLSRSLSLGMKYRRRIVKILSFYLLTSIVCWTPLQFTIVYRHFRSEAVPAGWFFELTFYAQLSASLSAAMNPIIFGFLSQHFRQVVTKSWMFRILDKVWHTRSEANRAAAGEQHAMARCQAPNNAMHNNHRAQNQHPNQHQHHNQQPHQHQHCAQKHATTAFAPRAGGSHNHNHNHQHQQQQQQSQRRHEQEPKLTIDYVDHHHQHHHHHQHRPHALERSERRAPGSSVSMSRRSIDQRPLSVHLAEGTSSTEARAKIRRSRSSGNQETAGASSSKRVSFNSKSGPNGSQAGGLENVAYLREEDETEGAGPRSARTKPNTAPSTVLPVDHKAS